MAFSCSFFCIVNSSYVGHAKAGDRSHREGKRATNPAALKPSPTHTHTSSEPNDAPMSAAKMPQQTGHEEKNTGGGRHGRLHVREKGVYERKTRHKVVDADPGEEVTQAPWRRVR